VPPRVPKPKAEYLSFLAPFPPDVQKLALATRALVLSECPGATELIYDAYNAVASGYGFTGRPSDCFIHVAVYAHWVNLGFNRGSQIPDPRHILQGKGNWIRHIRIASPADLSKPEVRAFVKAAIERAVLPDPQKPGEPGGSIVRAIYARKRRPKNVTP
jgi:hypothetical protein